MKAELKCRDGVRLLGAYLEGLLDAPTRRALDHHVTGCSRCQRFVQSYREVPRIFRQATAAAMPDRLKRSLRRLTTDLAAPARPRTS